MKQFLKTCHFQSGDLTLGPGPTPTPAGPAFLSDMTHCKTKMLTWGTGDPFPGQALLAGLVQS